MTSSNKRPKFLPSRLTSYDDEAIITEIKHVINQHFNGVCPTISNFNKYSKVKAVTIIKRFTSWRNAITKAGFEYNQARINKKDFISDLKRVLELNSNEYFTLEFYEKHGSHSAKTIKSRLGYSKWKDLLATELLIKKHYKTLKPKYRILNKPSKDELINDLKKVWDKLEKRPSWKEYKSHGSLSISSFESEFGTWTNAIEYCSQKFNLQIQRSTGLNSTPQLLLKEITVIVNREKLNSLQYKQYKIFGGSYSIGTFQNTFGSWKEACKEAGVRSARSLIYSDGELFDEIQRLWELYGREPKAREIKSQSLVSFNAFVKTFGSYSKTIHAFCAEREGLSPPNTFQQNEITRTIENTSVIKQKKQSKNGGGNIKMTTPRFPSKRLRFIILNRDKFRCVKCGRSPQKYLGTELHIDHIKPYSKGGETVEENLQTLCSTCNIGKSDLIL